ncbi:hypothetical protein JCM19045_397 [Bacillus sp. JCM 19045]|nr:hypothetical protein JCM19045_397 [Bacillus sp. JCM 19045]
MHFTASLAPYLKHANDEKEEKKMGRTWLSEEQVEQAVYGGAILVEAVVAGLSKG